MNKIFVALMLAGCIFKPAFGEEIKVSSSSIAQLSQVVSTSTFVWKQETTSGAYVVGEDLQFIVAWKFITVGYAHMGVDSIQDMGGRKAYHIATSAMSSPFFDNFYRVRDANESWIDTESLCSLKYMSLNDENNKKHNETILFDQVNHIFNILESKKHGTIPAYVQDVLSSLYYVRTKELVIGQDIIVDAHSGDLSWPLKVKVLKREKVSVPAGDFDCFLVEPALREEAGIFQQKGKLWVWLTADDRKIPVLMRSQIVVGAVEARLTGIKLK
jgi:hypothetical protein